jgi:hypothetical protein
MFKLFAWLLLFVPMFAFAAPVLTTSSIITLIVVIAIAAIVYIVVSWILGQMGLPEPIGKVLNILLVVIVAAVIIYALVAFL